MLLKQGSAPPLRINKTNRKMNANYGSPIRHLIMVDVYIKNIKETKCCTIT